VKIGIASELEEELRDLERDRERDLDRDLDRSDRDREAYLLGACDAQCFPILEIRYDPLLFRLLLGPGFL
jgi:hypothetical protein